MCVYACVCHLRPVAREEFFSKPKFSHQLEPDDCLSTSCEVISLDMHTVRVSDLEVRFHFKMSMIHNQLE